MRNKRGELESLAAIQQNLVTARAVALAAANAEEQKRLDAISEARRRQ